MGLFGPPAIFKGLALIAGYGGDKRESRGKAPFSPHRVLWHQETEIVEGRSVFW